jgi:DNA-binding MarR family transcriptional regulator
MNEICNNYLQMTGKPVEMGQPAFLLAQLGAHAAARFAERLATLSLTPPDAGILRVLRARPGLSQQELAGLLKIHPSRLVAILDSLEQRHFVVRRPNADDRRLYSLHLTDEGTDVLGQIGEVARGHQEALLAALNGAERDQLAALLTRIAAQQGLTPGVHPGYQQMRDTNR